MSETATSSATLAPYPIASNGKRNWAHSAVHPGEAIPSHDTLPDVAEGKSFGFSDLMDVINPLQHIPIVSNIYRAITGDSMSATGRVVGGLLFGGPIGFLAGVGETLMAETGILDAGERTLTSALSDSDSGLQMATSEVSSAYSKASALRAGAHSASGFDYAI